MTQNSKAQDGKSKNQTKKASTNLARDASTKIPSLSRDGASSRASSALTTTSDKRDTSLKQYLTINGRPSAHKNQHDWHRVLKFSARPATQPAAPPVATASPAASNPEGHAASSPDSRSDASRSTSDTYVASISQGPSSDDSGAGGEMAQRHSVTDPTDFANTNGPIVSDLDQAVRCEVCKDFFKTPMMTSCSHTFCSLCIRKALSLDGRCPSCRAEEQASRLKRNWTAQNMTNAWEQVRDIVHKQLKRAEEDDRGKKRKREEMEEVAMMKQELLSSTPSSSMGSNPGHSSSSRYPQRTRRAVVDEEFVPTASVIAPPSYAPFSHAPPSQPKSQTVGCPICGLQFKDTQIKELNQHLDKCLVSGPNAFTTPAASAPSMPPPRLAQVRPAPAATQQAQSSVPKRPFSSPHLPASYKDPRIRLPFLHYPALKDADLRRKMGAMGIPTSGTRPALERRHTHWVNLWNSNVDAGVEGKGTGELLRELADFDRAMASDSVSQAARMRVNESGDPPEERIRLYREEHSEQFAELIAQAKRTMEKAKMKRAAEEQEQI